MLLDKYKHSIILPNGRGVYNVKAAQVNREVEEYDERLRFGFNEANGDWVIYIKMPQGFDAAYFIEGEPVYPVIGFGKEIPEPGEAVKRLWKADTMQHGMKILDDINAHNQKIKDAHEEKASDGSAQMAEGLEWAHRKANL